MRGQIIKIISNDYYVNYHDTVYPCKCRGKFRIDGITPLVGDYVDFDKQNNYILDVYPRKNELVRPSVSNIDQAMIITSVKEPEFSSNLLDKLLVIIEFNNIKPIICFTKLDLLKTKQKKNNIKKYIKYYKSIGYQVYTNKQLFLIKRLFKNKVTVFAGQSGVGKSTLLNKLNKKLNLKTDEISKALGRGKHTTRHVELLKINNGLVADTPGFSSLDFIDMTKEDIRDNFIEFNKYKHLCEYRSCLHIEENNCGIKKAVDENKIMESRYLNYKNFISKK
jgi:ribosome biogenesis GTPase